MRSSSFVWFLAGVFLLSGSCVRAQLQSHFSLTGTAIPERVDPPIIDVNYKDADPDENAPYMASSHLNEFWKVRWSTKPDSAATSVKVDAISLYKEGQKIRLRVSGDLPRNAADVYCTV